MHPEVEELRPKLKEILYDCAVDIRATKAALYLYDGASRFELVTEYGFRGAVRDAADFNDPLIDRCGRGRTPFFVNGVAAEPRFSQLLFESSTDRLLAAPIYSRGKLVGLIDMRDKAGKLPFEAEDIPKAQRIAERTAEVFADKNIFGHRFITLSDPHLTPARPPNAESQATPTPAPAPAAGSTAPVPVPSTAAPRPAPPPPAPIRTAVPRMATVVIEARNAVARMVDAPAGFAIGEAEVAAARDVLRSILLIPGVVAATFSAFGHLGGVQEMAGRSTITEEARNLLQSKLNVWLTKRGEGGGLVRTTVHTPHGTSAPAVTPADVQKVFTAPVNIGSLRGLYLTVAFNENPERLAHELLAVLHGHLQMVIEHSMEHGAVTAMHARIAEKLLEPDFAKYPELRRHSELVSRLSESFARHLALPPHEVEQARVAGLVHDCGMRLLDYERLYRKSDLSPDELGFLREHPLVGAALVEPLLGQEIARIVLCHHERVDGRGYPNELHGEEIPMLSRVLQLCDAWVAMTDADTYQPPESRQSALAKITQAAGTQFDAALAPRFVEMVR